MNLISESSSGKKLTHADFSSENNPLQRIMQYGARPLIYAGLALCAVAILIYLGFSSSSTENTASYLKARVEFQHIARTGQPNEIQLNEFSQILETSPHLRDEYQAPFAQKLILLNQWELADQYIPASLKQAEMMNSSPDREFSLITQLIGQRKIEAALQKSMQLDAGLTSENLAQSFPLLKGFNLLRIAFLQQELGRIDDELLAWANFKNFQSKNVWNERNVSVSNSLSQIALSFHEGQMTLGDYISYRETVLKSKQPRDVK